MKPSEVASVIEISAAAGNPVHIEGSPGVGKTSVIGQVAKKLKRDLYVVRLSEHEPSDFQMPKFEKGECEFVVPKGLLPPPNCKPAFLFFDEWRQGHQQTQNVAGRLTNERCLGNYRLPDSVYVIGASNRAKDRAATNRMPSHIASRFTHISMEVDNNDWNTWAINDGGIDLEIIAFLRWRPKMLCDFDPSKDVSPNPRSWAMVDKAVKQLAKGKLKISPTVEEQMYAGMLGEGVASEFMGFRPMFRALGNPDAMLMNPETCKLPTDPATICALAVTIAAKATETNFDRVVKLANRLGDEYSVLTISQSVVHEPEVQNTRAYIAWTDKHQGVMS